MNDSMFWAGKHVVSQLDQTRQGSTLCFFTQREGRSDVTLLVLSVSPHLGYGCELRT